MTRLILIICLVLPQISFSQSSESGQFSLGVRTTISLFDGHEGESIGKGIGGQFRLRFSERFNSEWFLDYLLSDFSDLGQRQSLHIGWSVMYYLLNPKNMERTFLPYLAVGHCFDFARIISFNESIVSKKRWSAAVQAGLGMSINITPRFDLTIVSQYMLHLGSSLHAHVHDDHLHIEEGHGGLAEGHLLITAGFNYRLADFW